MDTLVTAHLRLGDIVVLAVLVMVPAAALYAIGLAITAPPRRKLSRRIATSVVVRSVSRTVDRFGRGFAQWN